MVQQIDVQALASARQSGESSLADAVLLDVRETWEFALARIEGAVNLPMSTLTARVHEVRELQTTDQGDKPIVLICHHGGRSMNCAQFLAAQGVEGLFNLSGGMDAWSQVVDPAIPRY